MIRCNVIWLHFISFHSIDGIDSRGNLIRFYSVIWFDLIWFCTDVSNSNSGEEMIFADSPKAVYTEDRYDMTGIYFKIKFKFQISHFKFQTLISMPRQTRSNLILSKRLYSVWYMDIYTVSCNVNLLFRLFASTKYEEQLSFNY